jgi:hypothetical protein
VALPHDGRGEVDDGGKILDVEGLDGVWWSGRLDTRHGRYGRDIGVDIEEAPLRWTCPEAGLEMPMVQNAFRCRGRKIDIWQELKWALLIGVGQPDQVGNTTLRASSHVTSTISSKIYIELNPALGQRRCRPEPSRLAPELPSSRVQDMLRLTKIKPSILRKVVSRTSVGCIFHEQISSQVSVIIASGFDIRKIIIRSCKYPANRELADGM